MKIHWLCAKCKEINLKTWLYCWVCGCDSCGLYGTAEIVENKILAPTKDAGFVVKNLK